MSEAAAPRSAPIQLAQAYGALANGGTIYTPRLAKAVLEGGSTLGEPRVLRELPVQPERETGLDQSIIDKIAAEMELDLVLLRDESTVLFVLPGLDVTDTLVKRYNAKYPS